MDEQEVVEINHLTKSFGKQKVLNDINLTIKKGEIVGILGPSGSGKTTLVKEIVGIGEPSAGDVFVFHEKIPSLSVIKKIGYMAQSDALYDDLNSYDILLYFAALYGWTGKKAKRRADQILELVDLKEHSKKLIRNYSGGMKRRLSLALALFHYPDLIILDEPTVGIDPILRKHFWNEFYQLRDNGATIIITTHVMDEAENCSRLILLRDGEMIANGSPAELKQKANTDTIEEAFLHYGSGKETVI